MMNILNKGDLLRAIALLTMAEALYVNGKEVNGTIEVVSDGFGIHVVTDISLDAIDSIRAIFDGDAVVTSILSTPDSGADAIPVKKQHATALLNVFGNNYFDAYPEHDSLDIVGYNKQDEVNKIMQDAVDHIQREFDRQALVGGVNPWDTDELFNFRGSPSFYSTLNNVGSEFGE